MRVYLDGFEELILMGRKMTRMMCNRIKGMIDHAPVPAVVLYCDNFLELKDALYMSPTDDEKRKE